MADKTMLLKLQSTVHIFVQMSVCDSISQVFEGGELCDHFWLCTARLAGRFQYCRLWQVPVVDTMDGQRVPWAVRKA